MSKPQSLEPARVMDDVGMKLLAAAEYVREHGWCQCTINTEDGRVCAMGAITLAKANGRISDAESRFTAYLNNYRQADERHRSDLHPIARWNDAPNRTADEVISALTSAAFHGGGK